MKINLQTKNKNGIKTKNGACLGFAFLYALWIFYGFLIVPEWLIKASGHIPILVESFLELPTFYKIWTFPPLFYCQNITKHTRNLWEHL